MTKRAVGHLNARSYLSLRRRAELGVLEDDDAHGLINGARRLSWHRGVGEAAAKQSEARVAATVTEAERSADTKRSGGLAAGAVVVEPHLEERS